MSVIVLRFTSTDGSISISYFPDFLVVLRNCDARTYNFKKKWIKMKRQRRQQKQYFVRKTGSFSSRLNSIFPFDDIIWICVSPRASFILHSSLFLFMNHEMQTCLRLTTYDIRHTTQQRKRMEWKESAKEHDWVSAVTFGKRKCIDFLDAEAKRSRRKFKCNAKTMMGPLFPLADIHSNTKFLTASLTHFESINWFKSSFPPTIVLWANPQNGKFSVFAAVSVCPTNLTFRSVFL